MVGGKEWNAWEEESGREVRTGLQRTISLSPLS